MCVTPIPTRDRLLMSIEVRVVCIAVQIAIDLAKAEYPTSQAGE